jgi:hypothetical protein
MELDTSRNILYYGGEFNYNVSISPSRMAIFNTQNSLLSTFNTGPTINGNVFASVYDSSRNLLYLGGDFTSVNSSGSGTLTTNSLIVWNFNAIRFYTLGTGLASGSIVTSLELDQSNNKLYFGGKFASTQTGGISLNNIGYWDVNASRYSGLKYGVLGTVNSIKLDTSRNLLYFGGDGFNTDAVIIGASSYNATTGLISNLSNSLIGNTNTNVNVPGTTYKIDFGDGTIENFTHPNIKSFSV